MTSLADIGYVEPSPLPTVEPTPTASGTWTPQPSAPTQTPDENGFLIQSNSIISAFSFSSSIPQVSFIVSGPNGTSGYVRLTIAKTFMPNSNMVVYLDGTQIQYKLEPNENSWVITFEYNHSTHQVIINQSASANPSGFPDWVWNAALALTAIGIAVAGVLLVWSAKRKPRIDAVNQP